MAKNVIQHATPEIRKPFLAVYHAPQSIPPARLMTATTYTTTYKSRNYDNTFEAVRRKKLSSRYKTE